MNRMLAVAGCSALFAVLSTVAAQAQETWQAYDYVDENGAPGANVVFGIPQTDATLFVAHCSVGTDGITADYYGGVGQHGAGAQVAFTIQTTNQVETRNAAVIEDANGRFAQLMLDPNDGVWENLMAASTAVMAIAGAPPVDLHLRGSRAAISHFLESCARISGAGSAPLLQALEGPLFVVTGAPVRAVSNPRDGTEVAQLAPGTEVMSTNAYMDVAGAQWAEVVTERGTGDRVWVEMAGLAPTIAGATEFQNLNAVADLVIRSGPAPDAAIIGAIPPEATGIMSMGQIYDDRVMVRYGSVTGWASHTYLLPMFPLDAPEPAVEPTGSARFESTFGAWTLDCDHCRHPEDGATCQLTTRSTSASAGDWGPSLSVFASLGPGDMNLVYDAYGAAGRPEPAFDGATLRIAVDDAAQTIPADGWVVEGMTGYLVVEQDVTVGMMPALRAGQSVLFRVSNGGVDWIDTFNLDGLAPAMDAMLVRLPFEGWTEDQCCAVAPESGLCGG